MKAKAEYDVFEAVNYEEISYCDTEEFAGGLRESEIFYCPIKFIEHFKTPLLHYNFEKAGSISEPILCKKNHGFKRIKALIDTSGFDSDMDGQIGKKQRTTDFELEVLGMRAQLIGWSRNLKNVPCVYIVGDANGRFFTIGSLVSPAYISSMKLFTGRKYEDTSGLILKINTAEVVYEYQNEIPLHEPIFGDFDSDFSTDFY